jgi:hypothetical protein
MTDRLMKIIQSFQDGSRDSLSSFVSAIFREGQFCG